MNRQQFNAMVAAQYGEKTVTDSTGTEIEWEGGAHCYLPSLKFFGKSMQYSTPTPDTPVDITDAIGSFVCDSNGEYITTPTLRAAGAYKDEWDYVTGKGLRYIHKVELDGVSDYKKVTKCTLNTNTNVLTCSIIPEYTLVSDSSKDLFVSTHFYERWTSLVSGCIFSSDGKSIAFGLDYSKIKSVTGANIWLAEQYANGTPVTIYYAMAEPMPFEERPSTYVPIPNDSGNIWWGDGTMSFPYQITYITHS